MRQTLVLVWKEWREQRWFLYGGLAVFLAFPLAEILDNLRRGFGAKTDMPEGIVLGLGGLLAIIVGVGATCRDLSPRSQSFWQSRPVGLNQWLAVKYLVGLVIVLVVCLVPLWLQWHLMVFHAQYGMRELITHVWLEGLPKVLVGVGPRFIAGVLACHTFAVVLIFSVAFLLGCLVRRAAQAAILSIAIGLFIYFLPVLVPPLACLGVINVMQNVFWDRRSDSLDSQYNWFVVAMLIGSGFALLLSNLALNRDWRLQIDKRVVIGTLGVVFLLLGSATAFQVGTNLTCLEWRYVDPPKRPARVGASRAVSRIIASGRRGVLVLNDRSPGDMVPGVALALCSFDLSAPGLGWRNEVLLSPDYGYRGIPWAYGSDGTLAWSETLPNRVYLLSTTEKWEDNGGRRGEQVSRRVDPILLTMAIDAPPDRAVIHRLDLSSYGNGSQICEYKGRIYFVCSGSSPAQPRIVVIDLNQPDAPRVAEVLESPGAFGVRSNGDAYAAGFEVTGVALPRIEGLSGQDRLELALRLTLDWAAPPMAFSDGLLVAADGCGLSTFRSTGIKGDLAEFERAGRHRHTLLEEALIRQSYRVVLDRGLAYTIGWHGLNVYDVRRPEYPRRVGHYASSGDWFGDVFPLPDGRILLGGSKLHVLAPPKLD